MSNISSFVLSICGIALIGVMVEIVLPNGKTSKLIKSVVSILSIFIIISPIKNINFKNLNITSIFDEIEIDSEFISNRHSEKIKVIENMIEKNLMDNGFEEVIISINGKYINEKLEIENLYVDLRKLVLLSEDMNIDKYNHIVSIIKNIISVGEEKIVFYE